MIHKLALNGKTIKLIHNSPDSNKSFLLEKKPLLNQAKLIVGTIFDCHELTENIIHHLIKLDEKFCHPFLKSYKVAAFENLLDLSARELECLFCVLRGMTAKRIANVLEFSK